MLKVIFPGSFDPPTNGHLNLIKRGATIFDKLEVVIAVNPQKEYLFSAEERFSMMTELVKDYENVDVHLWDKLIVEFAEKSGARVILRGVRALVDFGHEFELSMINKGLNARIETLFMTTDPKYFVLRSSAIKELVSLNGDVSAMVPPIVEKALKSRLLSGNKSP
ncbi:MAG: pantetheine-phosphate adenylyltransferase [Spirochaetes bacterium]|nr:MAG: pantetheine-phosphate adenylyltransferase [Spirochaetota bacterium]